MQIKQSTSFKVPIVLVDSNGVSITGKIFSDTTVFTQKQAGSSTVKTLASGTEWVEIDSSNFAGVYDLLLSSSDTNTVGWLKVSVKTATSTLALMIIEIVANVVSDVPSEVWNEARSSHTTAGTYGELHNVPTGTVVTNGGNTTTTFKTDRTESVNDYWKNAYILFSSGSLTGQVKRIGAYDGTTKFITLDTGLAFTSTPSGGDAFILIDR